MKRLIAVIVLAFATSAHGWEHIGRGIYRGDNYYWHAYKVCGCWYYTKLGPVANYPAPGSPNFYDKFAKWEFDAEEYQREADLIKSRFPGAVLPKNSAYQTTGYSVLSQGYVPSLVQSGTTLQATGPAYSPLDVNGIIHEAQRLQELAGVNSSQANAQVNTIVNSAVEGNTAAERIHAASELVSAALMATAPPPVTSSTVFQSRSIASNATASLPSLQPAGDAVVLLSHGLLMQNCAGCHNPRKLSHNLDLTIDPTLLAPARDAIEKAIVSGEMPKGHQRLSEAVINGILAGIPRGQVAGPPVPPAPPQQPPAPIQPPTDQPTAPPSDPMPLPPQDGTLSAPQS